MMSDITDSNQYLGIKTILDNDGGVLLTQQRKIEVRLRDFGLEDCNLAVFPMDNYISPPPPEHQAKNAD